MAEIKIDYHPNYKYRRNTFYRTVLWAYVLIPGKVQYFPVCFLNDASVKFHFVKSSSIEAVLIFWKDQLPCMCAWRFPNELKICGTPIGTIFWESVGRRCVLRERSAVWGQSITLHGIGWRRNKLSRRVGVCVGGGGYSTIPGDTKNQPREDCMLKLEAIFGDSA